MSYDWTITSDTGSPFDQTYNTLPGQQSATGTQGTPGRDFGQRPEAPKPGGNTRPGPSPDNVFDDAYNLLPVKPQDQPTDAKPEGPFDSKFNQLNKPSDFPAFKGRAQAFNQNGEIGNLYIDDRAGLIGGMEFSDGSRKGQKYVFDRDNAGNITKMHVLMPGRDAATSQYLIFEKTDKGWVSKPADQMVPNFKHLKVENGAIVGDFKVNAKGDLIYESKDKLTKNIVRLNGDKDYFDMREYSRERESINGQKATTYWNGYEWLPGQKTQVADGVIKVDFQPQPGKPASMIRDAKNNGFQVDFGQQKTQFKIENWNHGKMTRVHNNTTDTLYSTGAQNAEGKLQWGKGQEKIEGTQRVVTFNDPQDAARVRSGELPQASSINQQTGDVISLYVNGTQVASDSVGRQQRITYKNQQYVDVVRDTNQDLRGFRRSDGTTIAKGADLSFGNSGQGSAWTVQRPGQQPVEIQGMLKFGNAGSFNILNAGNDGVSVDPEGVLSTRVAGKVTSDQPVPGRDNVPPQPTPQVNGSDTPPAVPPRGDTRPPETAPKTDAPAAGKSPVTDQQLQTLATKHKINIKVLQQAKERAEKQGMHQTFTQERLDKLLELAAKHRLLPDFTERGVSAASRPGAVMGKLIPELLVDPDTALDKLQTQMKRDMQKSLQDGGAPQPSIDRALQTLDQRFRSYKTNTEPFTKELKQALGEVPATPPAPAPVPTNQQR